MAEIDTKREIRAFKVAELRADEAGSGRLIGYAARFNSLSEDLGWFREQIQPGAFAETIQNDDIRALWNHDSAYVLGRNKAGTLTLREDASGLLVEISPPDAQWAKDAVATVKRGDVSQMSFAFETLEEAWDYETEPATRTLTKVRLYEVSPVTFPAYADTSVAARSMEQHKPAKPEPKPQGDQSIMRGIDQRIRIAEAMA